MVAGRERLEPGLSRLQALSAGGFRRRGVAGRRVSVAQSWPYWLAGPLGCRIWRGLSSLCTPVLPPALRPVLAPNWDSVSHLGAEVGQDLRSFGKGCPWSC